MAFSLSGSGTSGFGSNAMAANNAQTQMGPDLEEIQTEVVLVHKLTVEVLT